MKSVSSYLEFRQHGSNRPVSRESNGDIKRLLAALGASKLGSELDEVLFLIRGATPAADAGGAADVGGEANSSRASAIELTA